MKNNKRYFLIIALGVIFVFGFNLLFYFSIESILFCLISFAIIIVPGALVMFMIRYFPKKWFDPNRKIFHVFNFESKLYESINIRKWKNKLPEPGRLLFKFDRSKVANPKDPEYLMTFMYENCRGSSSHLFCFMWGFASLPIIAVILPQPFTLTAGLLIAGFHGIIHLASLITLRYMRPRLMKLYHMNKEQIEKKKQQENAIIETENNTENNAKKSTKSKAKIKNSKAIKKTQIVA